MLANMADGWRHPSIRQKLHGQSYLFHQPSPNLWTSSSNAHNLSNLYLGGGLHNPPVSALASVSPVSHILLQAPVEKEKGDFLINFLMGGVSAAVSKTAADPIERVKLLLQNQDEIIKVGRLSEPYNIIECFATTIKEEGVLS
ncbi:hypothetical protein Nepgr_013942 [Nepenthes gracilis]|uniref:ADP/ATP translocase n=1 Tax=Nepenthes gracilis TaxID=150966 RepID=A0AAD3SKM6_NEPGR|nr:hypothetical protein Nepgr_013942 [Nepenthes gracilis]